MNKNRFPPVITWRLTSKCNNNCPYCYGPNAKIPDISLAKIEKMLKLFYQDKVKVIDLTGGEPLLRNDFEKIVDMIKEHGFEIFMDTNGDLFFKHAEIIAKNFKGISLTINFPEAVPNYKNKRNFVTMLNILDYLGSLKKRPIIRVGTVVTRNNYRQLSKIGKLLSGYKIDLWKLYQFIPQNKNAMENRSVLEIPKKDFLEATKGLKKRFSQYFKVIISKIEERDSCYFFVGSDGTVFMPTQKGDIFQELNIGSVFEKNIVSKWQKIASQANFIKNTGSSLKYKFK